MNLHFRKIRIFNFIFPCLILTILWAFLYLYHLRSNPSWFMDETKTLNSAINLAQKSPSYLATWNTFFHPVTSYQPPYLFFTGIFAHGDILGARFFNALLGLIISFLLYILGRRLIGTLGAFFAALLFLTYDQTLIHFRAVYPHNGVALGTTIAALFLSLYPTKRKEWLAGIGLACAAASHPMCIYPMGAAWLTRWKQPRSWIRLFTPAILYFIITLSLVYLRFGNWLMEDIQELWRWYTEDSLEQGSNFFTTFFQFYSKDWFHIGALLSIFFCWKKKTFQFAAWIIVISILLFQNRKFYADFYYQAVLLIPLLSLCWGASIQKFSRLLRKRKLFFLKNSLLATLACFCIVQASSSIWIWHLDSFYRHEIIQQADQADEIAHWINLHTTPQDTVVVNANICWLLHAKKVHYLQAAAATGLPALYYRGKNIPYERCLYDISLENAKYVVFSKSDILWEPSKSDVEILVEKMSLQHWKKIFVSKEYAIFQNPFFVTTQTSHSLVK